MAEKRFIRLGNPLFLLLLLLAGIAAALYWNEGQRAMKEPEIPTEEVLEKEMAPAEVEAPAEIETPKPAGREYSPEAAILKTARAHVLYLMKDPDSAQFRNERVLDDGRTICMEVNGKNAYGGYVGYQNAVVILNPGNPVAWIDSSDTQIARAACE